MNRLGRAFISAVAVCLVAVVGTGMARRSDNTYSFGYDAEKDEISYAASSTRMYRRDGPRTSLLAYVRDHEVPDEPPLRGDIIFSSHSKNAVNYRGTIRLVIRSGDEIAYEARQEVDWRLGGRTKTRRIQFLFGLPSGDYSTTAHFKASD